MEGSPDEGFRVALDTFGTLRDLSNAGVVLQEGLVLQIYDWSDEHEDLEADAVARFDNERKIWFAVIDKKGYRYVTASARDQNNHFLCVSCRRDIGANAYVLRSGLALENCPACGCPLSHALAPPQV